MLTVAHHNQHSEREWKDAHGLLKLEGLARDLAATTDLTPLKIRKRLLDLPEYKKNAVYRLPHGVNEMIKNWVKNVRRSSQRQQQPQEVDASAEEEEEANKLTRQRETDAFVHDTVNQNQNIATEPVRLFL